MVANYSWEKPKQIHPIVVLHACFLLFLADACWQSSIEHLGSHVICSEGHKGNEHSVFDLSNHLIVHCLLLLLMFSVIGKRVWELSYTKVTEASCRNSQLTLLII